MRKRILPMICVVCLILMWSGNVSAAELNPNEKAGLTLRYQQEGTAFSGLDIGIYRIAEAFSDGRFELIEPFSSYPINIQGITSQTQWTYVAETLAAYILAYQVEPDRVGKTDENGNVRFSDLKTGLYFVHEVVAENENGTYVFNQFLVYVPTPQPDGTYLYDVEAIPKCLRFVPKSQYTVTKLWQDGGNQEFRPKEVTVEIYRNGTLWQTQILNAANNWSYTWSVSGNDTGTWSVLERTVQEPYKVTIQQNGSAFSIINTYHSEEEPPKTGDTFSPLPWVLMMCFSGILLVILGLYGRRVR